MGKNIGLSPGSGTTNLADNEWSADRHSVLKCSLGAAPLFAMPLSLDNSKVAGESSSSSSVN